MKKILALIIAVVMVFSIAAIPASATAAESGQAVIDNFNSGDYMATIDSLFTFIEDLIDEIHDLVGSIMGVLGEECAFCEEIHVVETAPAA